MHVLLHVQVSPRGVSHTWTMLGHIRLGEMLLVESMRSQRRYYEFVLSVVTCR